jgi:hypothetical protein
MAEKQTGYLTIMALESGEIYGEFAGAELGEDDGGLVISGLASEGTAETFRRINLDGIETVRYRFEGEAGTREGNGRLLALEHADAPAAAVVRIEPL